LGGRYTCEEQAVGETETEKCKWTETEEGRRRGGK
jgi:hypothetical protein